MTYTECAGTLKFWSGGKLVCLCDPTEFTVAGNLDAFHVTATCQWLHSKGHRLYVAVCDARGTVLVYVFGTDRGSTRLVGSACFVTGIAGITGMKMTSSAIAFWNKESVWVKRSMYDTACPVGHVTPCTSAHVLSECGHLAYIQQDNRVCVITDRLIVLNISCETLHWIGENLLLFSGRSMTMVNGESILSGTPTVRHMQFASKMNRILQTTDDLIIVESAAGTEAAQY
jgi:hypothetical protein